MQASGGRSGRRLALGAALWLIGTAGCVGRHSASPPDGPLSALFPLRARSHRSAFGSDFQAEDQVGVAYVGDFPRPGLAYVGDSASEGAKPSRRTELPGAGERPLPPPAPTDNTSVDMLRQLSDAAASRYEQIENYTCVLTRQERVDGRLLPRERLQLAFRKSPWSVHLSWLEKPNRGREVLYVPGQYEDKIHGVEPTLLGKIRLRLDPFGSMAMRNSRYPITEAGLGSIIEKLREGVDQMQGGAAKQALRYVGSARRAEFPQPLEQVRHVLPDGSRRDVFFDPESGLPALVETVDTSGELQEYYAFDDLQINLPDLRHPGAFDPDQLFSRKGLRDSVRR